MSGELLVVAEHVRGELRPGTREAVTAAAALAAPLGGRVVAVVVAVDPDALVPALALAGVDEILAVRVDREPTSDTLRDVVGRLLGERPVRAVIAGFTVDAMGYAPAVAAAHGLGFASDVLEAELAEDVSVVARELHGGKVRAELELPARCVLLLRPTAWAEATAGERPPVSEVPVDAPAARVRHRAYVDPPSGDVDITKADVLLAVGRGIGEQANVAVFADLAERLGVTLAASRPLVDAGWVAAARQVGQSGNAVKPKLYLAFGISGAVQHVAGMRGAATIVAVNTDPDAPIFAVADHGAVADAGAVAAELAKLL